MNMKEIFQAAYRGVRSQGTDHASWFSLTKRQTRKKGHAWSVSDFIPHHIGRDVKVRAVESALSVYFAKGDALEYRMRMRSIPVIEVTAEELEET
jgi:hypothetical protein